MVIITKRKETDDKEDLVNKETVDRNRFQFAGCEESSQEDESKKAMGNVGLSPRLG